MYICIYIYIYTHWLLSGELAQDTGVRRLDGLGD